MTPQQQETLTTWQQAQKSDASILRSRRLAMLRSMLQKYPSLRVRRQAGGCGVYTDDGIFLYLRFSKDLTEDQLTDLLALLRVLLAVDPSLVCKPNTPQDG